MKTLKNLLHLCILAVLAACSEDAFVPQSEEIQALGSGSVDFISMTVPDIEIDNATTRSKLIDDGTELKFVWQENDAIGVVPLNGRPLSFPIHAENAQKNTAVFDGGDWALKTSTKYAAFFPIKSDNQNTDIKNIAFDYEGQTETNYASYDFLATGAVKPKDGAVKFTMKRLSAILKIRVTMPAGSYGRYGTLIPNKTHFNMKGTLDLSGTEPVFNVTEKARFIHTQLNAEKTSTSGWTYDVMMMIPAADCSDQVVTFRITSDKGYAYETYFQGKNFEAGKAYLLEGTASDARITNTNLIEAAESGNSITFKKITGSGAVNVNDETNQTLLKQVKKIEFSPSLRDSTACNQIAYFPNLERLDCAYIGLTFLDVSKNTALTYLECGSNKLTSLDVSKNTALIRLYCYKNQLTSLDVSKNTMLNYLLCYSNQLTSLDVSKNTALITLQCYSNKLSTLDVSNNTALTFLYCQHNQVTSLDVSKNTALIRLDCYSNQLTSLDVLNNTALEDLSCYDNRLTSLDVSNNTVLETLFCGNNQLTSLDVSNNTALADLSFYNNQLTTLDVSNNTELATLNCQNNQISEIDLSENTKLTELYCDRNKLTSLDISNNTKLNRLQCFTNLLTSLDVSQNTALTTLDCANNQITSLDVSNNMNLKAIDCSSNLLETFTVKNHSSLQSLRIRNNPNLTDLVCTENVLETLIVESCSNLNRLECQGNNLTTLDVSTLTNLTILGCYDNLMEELDIKKNTLLKRITLACGRQWTDSSKTENQILTLYVTSENSGVLPSQTTLNSYVQVVVQD